MQLFAEIDFTFCFWKEINFPSNRIHWMQFLCIYVFTCRFLGTSPWLPSNSEVPFKGIQKNSRPTYCLKVNPSSVLRIALLLFPVESVNFLKLHRPLGYGPQWHFQIISHPSRHSTLALLASLPSTNFLFIALHLLQTLEPNSQSSSPLQVLLTFPEHWAHRWTIYPKASPKPPFFPHNFNGLPYHSISVAHILWIGPVPLSVLEMFMSDFLNVNITI